MEEGRLAAIDINEKLGYLSVDKAAREKRKIRESLFALRSGPFGRHRAKLEIIRKMKLARKE